MVNQNVMRRGVCPGVWAPMESGDGLLVRVRARRGQLQASQIRALAHAARSFGNGIIELTRRANLQLRGVSPASLPGLQAELVRLQLAGASAQSERQPALAVCPLAGLDPRCPPLEPVAEALESLLATPELTRCLSEKFSVLVSGGSDLFGELEVDLRVQLSGLHPGWAHLSIADGARGALELGACRSIDVARAVHTLLVLLGAAVPEHARMRQLVAAGGSSALSAALAPLVQPLPAEAAWPAEVLGLHSVAENPVAENPVPENPVAEDAASGLPGSGPRSWFGFELPFGSLETSDWDAIADLAERFGSGQVRLLPGRAVLLPAVRKSDATELAQAAAARHFIVERPVPWLRLVACSGAPACRSAHAETRRLACDLAALVRPHLQRNATLHVSGCEKGCAWGGAADITLVHGADGCRLGGGASVAQTARAAALSLDSVRERLRRGFVQEGLGS